MKKVEVKILVSVSPSEVIDAFTNANKLSSWWNVQKSFIDLHEGGAYVLAWEISETGYKYVTSGVIGAFNQDSLLQIENVVYLSPGREILGPMRIIVNAQRSNNNTIVTICQDGYKEGEDWDWYYQAVKTAWPMVVESLKRYLENARHVCK